MHYFWSVDPKQFAKHIKIYNKLQERKFREINQTNHNLGMYVRAAFGAKDYPKEPYGTKPEKTVINPNKGLTDEDINSVFNSLAKRFK